MKVFLAGATGAIGRPLVARLLGAGHQVVGTTRSQSKAAELRARGVEAVVLDAFDRRRVHEALAAAGPDVVIHQLTALPQRGTRSSVRQALAETARLRRETVPSFVAGARAAGARRFLVQSISFVTRPEGPSILDESAPLWLDAPKELRDSIAAVRDLERAALGCAGIEAVVLRYGFFYGEGTWYSSHGTIAEMVRKRLYPLIGDGGGRSSFVHVDDAAEATLLALDHGAPGVYNVTDDEPALQREWLPELSRLLGAKPPLRFPPWLASLLAGPILVHYSLRLRGASNAKARSELGFRPRGWREGFRQVFG